MDTLQQSWAPFFLRKEVQLVVFGLGTTFTLKITRSLWKRHQLKAKRIQKQKERDVNIAAMRQRVKDANLSEVEVNRITRLAVSELIKKLQMGELKAVQVLQAYQAKALAIHDVTNCATEFILEADEWAKNLDAQKEHKGALHGVPISLKEEYMLKGKDSTIGCAKFIGCPAEHDSVAVTVMMSEGAIPFIRTNLPQTMMSVDSCNPIYGQTVNPYNPELTAGGSSGGEGALVGAGGSPIGLASDIGGSIRIPAHFNGCYGLKPSIGTLSYRYLQGPTQGQLCLQPVIGPISRSIEGLTLFMKVMMGDLQHELDPYTARRAFDDEIYSSKRKLRIGYYTQDGFFTAVPAQVRGVLEAKDALMKQGHEVVPIELGGFMKKCMSLYCQTLTADGGEELFALLSGDEVSHCMKSFLLLQSVNNKVKSVIGFLLKYIYPHMSILLLAGRSKNSVAEWFSHVGKVENLCEEFLALWDSWGVDAIMGPTYAAPAVRVGDAANMLGALSYTTLYNIVDFASGTIPVSNVTQIDQEKAKDYPLTELWNRVMKRSLDKQLGCPISVQVVTKPMEEELCLRIMAELEKAVCFKPLQL